MNLADRMWNSFDVDPDDNPAREIERRILGKYGLLPGRQLKYQDMPQENVQGLQDKLLGAGGSVLGFIGGTIDKIGFRQLRALASGHLEDIPKSLIPFGGSLGIDDQSSNLSWDDILRGQGRIIPRVMKDNDPTRWEVRDFVGPALDMAVGPHIPRIGPMNAYGRAAQRANALPRTMGQQFMGYADDVAGLAARGPSSPLPMNRWGGLAPRQGLPQFGPPTRFQAATQPIRNAWENLTRYGEPLPERVMEGLSDIPRTAEAYSHHPLYQSIAPEAFTRQVAESGLPAYTPGTPLRAALEIGAPLIGSRQFQAGPRTMRAAQALSKVSDRLQFGRDIWPRFGIQNPIPQVRNLFDPDTGKALEPEVQFSNMTQAVPIRQSIRTEALRNEANMRQAMHETVTQHNLQGFEPQAMSYVLDRAEGLPVAGMPNEWINERFLPTNANAGQAAIPFQQAMPQLNQIAGTMRERMDFIREQSQRHGLPFSDLRDEYVDYIMRATPQSGAQSFQQSLFSRIFNPNTGSNIRRQMPYRDNPTGTSGINVDVTNPQISGPNRILTPGESTNYIVQRQMPDALRAFRQNITGDDLINRFLPNMDLQQMNQIARQIGRPGLERATAAREMPSLVQGIHRFAQPQNIAEFTRILPPLEADILLNLSRIEPALGRLLQRNLQRPFVQGGPHYNQLLELARIADPAAGRTLARGQSVLDLRNQVPGLIQGMSVTGPGLRRYQQILEHPTISPLVPQAFRSATQRANFQRAVEASMQGMGLPTVRRLANEANPLLLQNIQQYLGDRLRPALARSMGYGQEDILRNAIRGDDLGRAFEESGAAARLQENARTYAQTLGHLAPEHAAEGRLLFDADTIRMVTQRQERQARALGANAAGMDIVRRHGRPAAELENGMPAYEYAQALSTSNIPAHAPMAPGQQITLNAYGFQNADEARALIEQADMGNPMAARRLRELSGDNQQVADNLRAMVSRTQYSGRDRAMLEALGPWGFPGEGGQRFTAEQVIRGTADPHNLVGLPRPRSDSVAFNPLRDPEAIAPPQPPTAQAALSEFAIPRNLAQDALANQVRHMTPHEIQPFQNLWDQYTNIQKALLYPIWPASQIRNYMSGMYNNWATNSYDPRYAWYNPRRYLQPQIDMMNLLRGRNIEPLPRFANLPPEQARIETLKLLYSNRIAFQEGMFNEMGDAGELANAGRFNQLMGGPTGTTIPQDVAATVRRTFAPYADALRGRRPAAGWDSMNPIAIRNVGGRTEDVNTIINTSRQVGGLSEDLLRGGQGLALLRQGFEPAAAAARTMGTHFDYRHLADFEKNWMRRIFPFYTFTRKNLPFQVQQLLGNPEKTARTVQLFNRLRGNTFVPSFMGGGFAVPMGQEENGNQRFMSQTGLPIEEAFEKLKLSNAGGIPMPDVRGTAFEYMGMMNPLIKGAAEQLFDRQFFTGRRLSDLKPSKVGSLGGYLEGENAQFASQLLANSPLSRFVSTLEKAIDSRKSGVGGVSAKLSNLLTGLKFSDVDMERARNTDIRRALEEAMRKDPSIATFMEAYIPKDKFDEVSKNRPDTMQLMQLHAMMKRAAREAAAKRELDRRTLMPVPR